MLVKHICPKKYVQFTVSHIELLYISTGRSMVKAMYFGIFEKLFAKDIYTNVNCQSSRSDSHGQH